MGSIFMRKEKTRALDLRLQGYSYTQIGKLLKIPKSTLSYWLCEIKLSKNAQAILNERSYKKSTQALIKRNKSQTLLALKRAALIKDAAKKEFSKFSQDKLFLTGVNLYWAEGYKKGAYGSKWKSVDFANSDPEMISLMMKFFLKNVAFPFKK